MRNFEFIRKSVGVSFNEPEKSDNLGVDEIFRNLRPESPYKLSEMVDPKFDPEKGNKYFNLKLSSSMKLKKSNTSEKYINQWNSNDREYLRKRSAEQIKQYFMYKNISDLKPPSLTETNTKITFSKSNSKNTNLNKKPINKTFLKLNRLKNL